MFQINPNVAYWILFIAHWLLYFFDQWIKWRQYSLHLKTKTCPFEIKGLITDSEFAEARKDALKFDKLNFAKDFLGHLAFMAFFFSGVLPIIWKWIDETSTGENVNTVRMFIIVFAITFLIIVNRSCCIQKSKKGYDTDSIMWFLFGDIPIHSTAFTISTFIFVFAVWFSKKVGHYFYIYLWGMSAIFIILNVAIVYIFSFILAPCLFDNSEMPESVLKREIISLTEKCKHPMTKICLEEHKSKGNHNACVYGLPNNRRMAILSNLIKQGNTNIITTSNNLKDSNSSSDNNSINNNLTINEILGILAHSICFWNSKLPLFILIIGLPYLFICYFSFGHLYQNPYLFETFGFPNSHPPLIGIIIPLTVIFPLFNQPIAKFIRTYFRRKSILNADDFAAKYGYSEALSNALIKLNKDRKNKDCFPINDILYSNYFCPQPTILDRIQRLRRIDNSNQSIQLNEIQSN